LARLARAGDHERRTRRRAGDGVAERIQRRLARRADDRRHVRARDRVLAVEQDLPLGQDRAVPGVERVEALEAERRRDAELDRAERRARTVLGAEMSVDQAESVAPRHRRAQRRVDDLVSRHRDDTGRERWNAGQKPKVTGRDVAEARWLAHGSEQYHDSAGDGRGALWEDRREQRSRGTSGFAGAHSSWTPSSAERSMVSRTLRAFGGVGGHSGPLT